MCYRSLGVLLLLLAPGVALGDDDARARALAQEILDRGSALFDKRDAAAMAATYVETAEIILVKRESDPDRIETEFRRGRAEIQQTYADLFKDRLPEHRSRNTVVAARFLSQRLLLIQGRFAMDREQGDSIQFVQLRALVGEQWQIVTLQMMELAEKNP